MTEAIDLYRAACRIRGCREKEIREVRYRPCDNNFDLYATDGCIILSDPEISLVIFEDWRRVRVPAGWAE